MEKEIRSYQVDFRKCKEDRMIEGRGIPFNVFSPNREGFREMVAPEAIEGVIENSDIKMLYNHDNSKGFLARSNKGKGSLVVDVRDDGVYFLFDCPTDNLGEYVYQRMLREELDETSWAFTIKEDRWVKAEDGVYERTITKFDKIYDMSIVDNSYYGIEGAVKCARFAEILEEEKAEGERKMAELKAEEEKRAAEEEAQKKAEIEEYYKQIKEVYKDYLK